MIDETADVSPQQVITRAEKIIPTLEATEQASKSEMQKTISLAERYNREIGPFCTVYGKKGAEGRFAFFNEPVQMPGEKIGLIFATGDGFMVYSVKNDNAGKFHLNGLPFDIKKNEEKKFGGPAKYTQHLLGSNKPGIEVGRGNFGIDLDELPDDSLVVGAIEASIAKAQEAPKKIIAKNKQTIEIASKAQVVIAQSALKK